MIDFADQNWQAPAPQAVACDLAVARRHGIAPSHLFAWRKVFRAGDAQAGLRGFAPVIVDHGQADPMASRASGRMEVALASGRRIIIGADFDAAALARLVLALERA